MSPAWDCPRCNATLGRIHHGALYVRPGVTIRQPSPVLIEIVCRCGGVKSWWGRRVIVIAENRAKL